MVYDVTALGELLVDFTESGFSQGGMRLFEQNPGGSVTNVLAAAARYGLKTAFIGKVGEDMHGHFLAAAMEKAGVDVSRLRYTKEAFTTLAFVALAADGDREFSFARHPGADTCLQSDELGKELLANTRVMHTSSLSLTDEPARSATYEAIRIAKEAGAIITYDPNYRASLWKNEAEAAQRMRTLIATADIIKLSDVETELLTDEKDPESAAIKLYNMGVELVAVTLGSEGALMLAKGKTQYLPAYKTKAVDATGAGDAFLGSFIYRVLELGKRVEDVSLEEAVACADFAQAAASLCVEGRGGIPSMPALEAVLGRMGRK